MPFGDEDGDNIPDEDDDCLDTPEDETANSEGCSPSQTDTDGDTVFDDVDICPDTPSTEIAKVIESFDCAIRLTAIQLETAGPCRSVVGPAPLWHVSIVFQPLFLPIYAFLLYVAIDHHSTILIRSEQAAVQFNYILSILYQYLPM